MTIHTGDCIELMAGMDADSVDAIVTDPPYGLEFMGKEWDRFATNGFRRKANPADVGRDDAFGRTSQHAPEYRAGSPFQAWCEAWGREALRVTRPGGYLLAFGGTRTHHRLVCGLEDAGWIIRDELDWIYASGFPKGKANLKPAHEPIVLARKPGPLQALRIDQCRIGTSKDIPASPGGKERPLYGDGWTGQPGDSDGMNPNMGRWPSNVLLSEPALFDERNAEVVGSGATANSSGFYEAVIRGEREGPASIPLDNGPQYGDSGGYSRFFIVPKADRNDREPVLRGQLAKVPLKTMGDGAGEWSRHGPDNENLRRENAHPTVKPVDLMRHLVRLVTPAGGTVLDPFLGSGSTAIAAELEGFPWVGIEKEAEYVAIAEARLNGTQRGLGLDVPAPIERRVSVDGVAVRHNSGGNTFGGDSPKPPMPDMTYRQPKPDPVPVAEPTAPMFPEEVA